MARSATSFKKGKSGNPGGMKKDEAAQLQELRLLALEHCKTTAIKRVAELMKDENGAVAVKACDLMGTWAGLKRQIVTGEAGGPVDVAFSSAKESVLQLLMRIDKPAENK